MDYEGLEVQEAIPEASSMIETFRAIGYNLETAVADIVDNSITAGASRITIQRYWRGGKSVITIIDNGCGMNNEELIHAMRPGAQNPLEERDEKDLGRFGLENGVLLTMQETQCFEQKEWGIIILDMGFRLCCFVQEMESYPLDSRGVSHIVG